MGREKPAEKLVKCNRKPPALSSVHKHCTVSEGKQLALLIPVTNLLGCVEAADAVCPLMATLIAFSVLHDSVMGASRGCCDFFVLFLFPEKDTWKKSINFVCCGLFKKQA